MPKDTKSLGNNKAPACESRGFVRKKKKVCFFDTPSEKNHPRFATVFFSAKPCTIRTQGNPASKKQKYWLQEPVLFNSKFYSR